MAKEDLFLISWKYFELIESNEARCERASFIEEFNIRRILSENINKQLLASWGRNEEIFARCTA